MKESLILGMMAGFILGAFMVNNCDSVKKAVEKGKTELKKQVEKL